MTAMAMHKLDTVRSARSAVGEIDERKMNSSASDERRPPKATRRARFRLCSLESAAATEVSAHAFAAGVRTAQASERIADLVAIGSILVIRAAWSVLALSPVLLAAERIAVLAIGVGVLIVLGILIACGAGIGIGQLIVRMIDFLHFFLGQIFKRVIGIVVRMIFLDKA